jgi:hypothetical protein
MSDFPILDLILGVIFLYFLLSIVSSSVIEIALTVMRVRARVLEAWFLEIFQNKIPNAKGAEAVLGRELIHHCGITALSKKIAPKKSEAPSYIDAKNFVSALLDKVTANSKQQDPKTITEIIESLNTTSALPPELKKNFILYAHEANDTVNTVTQKTVGAIELFRVKLENWYDSNMDRLTGAMKALYTRRFTFITAVVITFLLNADTIRISRYLYSNDEARSRVAAKAYETGTDEKIKAEIERLRSLTAINDTAKINSLNQLKDSLSAKLNAINMAQATLKDAIPIGWTVAELTSPINLGEWLLFALAKLIGLAVTVLAIMMGAPFWFDILNKISNLRGTGPKPASSTGTNYNNTIR